MPSCRQSVTVSWGRGDMMEFKYTCRGYPWMEPAEWVGTVCPLQPFEPCEYEVNARGSYFHVIIGEHSDGKYLCIPNWGIGIYLSDDGNRKWNLEQLLEKHPAIHAVDAVSIVDAITAILEHKQ